MYEQAAIKPNSLLRNGAYGIVMRGVQKCTRGCSSLRGRKRLPLCCIKLDTATDVGCGTGTVLSFIGRLSWRLNQRWSCLKSTCSSCQSTVPLVMLRP